MVISRWDLPSGYVNSLLLKMAILTKVGDFVPFSNRMVMFQFVFWDAVCQRSKIIP